MVLNLEKVWEVLNKISYEETKLSEEQGKWVRLLGRSSSYCTQEFNSFLNYYSFWIDGDDILVFNDDKIAWEDFSNDDVSSVPLCLLSFSDEKLDSWIETDIGLQLARQEREKDAEKENIKNQIERLQKQLEK